MLCNHLNLFKYLWKNPLKLIVSSLLSATGSQLMNASCLKSFVLQIFVMDQQHILNDFYM